MREKKQAGERDEGGERGAPAVPGSWLLAAWILGVAYLLTMRVPGPAPTTAAAWPVVSIARWGAWLLPLGAWFVVMAERKRLPVDLAPVSLAALGLSAGSSLLAYVALLLVPGRDAGSIVPVFLVQATAVSALVNARGSRWPRSPWPTSPAEWGSSLVRGAGAAVALLSTLSAFVILARWISPAFGDALSLDAAAVAWNRDLWEVALKILAIPFCEEILFRAGVIGWLRPRMGPAFAVALSAALFSALHGQAEIFWARFAGGLFMGWLYMRNGHVGPSFVLHAITNAGIYFGPLVARSLGWA